MLASVSTLRIERSARRERADVLAIEEPLEIRLGSKRGLVRQHKTVSITMRTPGHDRELAAGFLYTEAILRHFSDLVELRHCGPAARDDGTSNVVRAELSDEAQPDLLRLERHLYTASSCGVCGKTSLEAVRTVAPHTLEPEPIVAPPMLHGLPEQLRQAQHAFEASGGLHAAGLFSADGVLRRHFEDVGRHNAVDKVVGAELLAGSLPKPRAILLVSGRASFELVQKALMAGIPILAAVGAPSSLAVDLAREANMTLVGFLRDGRFNVYTGAERIGDA